MKKRHVFATESVSAAQAVVAAAHQQGVDDRRICLEARSDLEVGQIDDDSKNVSMDFLPAAFRGTFIGSAVGLLAGVLAMLVPFFGLSLAGVFALLVLGALVGTWASILMGSALPDDVRRTFAGEIETGKVLVVIDAEPEEFGPLEIAIARAGGTRLPYEANTVMS